MEVHVSLVLYPAFPSVYGKNLGRPGQLLILFGAQFEPKLVCMLKVINEIIIIHLPLCNTGKLLHRYGLLCAAHQWRFYGEAGRGWNPPFA